jgi:hypothetical protein
VTVGGEDGDAAGVRTVIGYPAAVGQDLVGGDEAPGADDRLGDGVGQWGGTSGETAIWARAGMAGMVSMATRARVGNTRAGKPGAGKRRCFFMLFVCG